MDTETVGGLVIIAAIVLIALFVRHIVHTHNEATEEKQTPPIPDNQPPPQMRRNPMDFFTKRYETAFEALKQYGEYAHMSDINGIRAIELGAVLYMVADFAARRTDIDRANFRADVVEWLDKKTNHGEQDIRELFFPRVRFYRSVILGEVRLNGFSMPGANFSEANACYHCSVAFTDCFLDEKAISIDSLIENQIVTYENRPFMLLPPHECLRIIKTVSEPMYQELAKMQRDIHLCC